MNVVGLVYQEMTSQVQIQILRDLLALTEAGKIKDVAVSDPACAMDPDLLEQIDIPISLDPPSLYILYRTKEDWPDLPPGAGNSEVVERDMYIDPDEGTTLDLEPKVGYYLRPQGRDGANMTEVYLNRAYPKGMGVTDPLVLMMWG